MADATTPAVRAPWASGALKRNFKGAYTIWYRDVLRFFTDRMRIVSSIGQPLLFLVVFGTGLASAISNLGGGAVDYRVFMFPGILAMTVLFTSVFSAISVVWDREFGFLKEVMVAPVTRTSVAIGKVLGGSTVAMLQGTILLLLAPLIGISVAFSQVILVMLLMLLLAAMMSAFGILLAARQKTMEGFQMIMNFLLMPMLFISGAFFPLTDVPGWLEFLARLNPVTYGVDAIRQVMLAGTAPDAALEAISLNPLGVDVLVMIGFLVAFLVPAVWLFSRRD
jgi:ABC-2 type transport system permease protein